MQQSDPKSDQLVGVIVGALLSLLAPLSLLLIVISAILLIPTNRRRQKLYDVPISLQSQDMDNSVYIGKLYVRTL